MRKTIFILVSLVLLSSCSKDESTNCTCYAEFYSSNKVVGRTYFSDNCEDDGRVISTSNYTVIKCE